MSLSPTSWGTGAASGGGVAWVGPFTCRAIDTIYVTTIPATGGTFTLTVNGEETAPIAFDASLTAIVAAIVALSGVTAEDVELDPAFGNIAFALGFLSTGVTGDGSNLTGVGAALSIRLSDRVVPLYDIAEGLILDNAVCFRTAEFDDGGPTEAWLTTAEDGSPSGSQWSTPSHWILNDEIQTTDLYEPDSDSSGYRTGLREVSYESLAAPATWYVPLPSIALADSTLYLVIDNNSGDGTQGEISVYLQIVTPQAA